MNKGPSGIKNDAVLASIISDKPSLMIRLFDSPNEKNKVMTLKSTEYRILSNRIIFFEKILSEWCALPKWQSDSHKKRVQVIFFYKGKGLYFISSLKNVKNGYALLVPHEATKVSNSPQFTDKNRESATIHYPGSKTVHAECISQDGFELFDSQLWLHFSKATTLATEKYLKQIVGLTRTSLPENCMELVERTKLLLHIPHKKMPDSDYFPYTLIATTDHIEPHKFIDIQSELSKNTYDTYIPFAENQIEKVHSLFGINTKKDGNFFGDPYNTLLLLPICRFFAENNEGEHFVHTKSLGILCLNESYIVLGGRQEREQGISTTAMESSFPLRQGLKYTLQLTIPLPQIKRTIDVTMLILQLFQGGNGKTCALCRFLDLHEEDKRFLYEKFYDTLCV